MANIGIKLNHSSILSKIEDGAKEKLKRAAFLETQKRARAAQVAMLSYFDQHPITLELKQGSGKGENISNTINGNGNLFSFIGFKEGDDPTLPLRNVLESPLDIHFMGILKRGKNASEFRYRIGVPSLNFRGDNLMGRIENATPIPWLKGESWVTGLKEGISGIGQYLYVEAAASSSGKGIQNVKALTPKTISKVDYAGQIFSAFIAAL